MDLNFSNFSNKGNSVYLTSLKKIKKPLRESEINHSNNIALCLNV